MSKRQKQIGSCWRKNKLWENVFKKKVKSNTITKITFKLLIKRRPKVSTATMATNLGVRNRLKNELNLF